MSNPFHLTYDALYNVVARSPRVRSLVVVGNIVSYDQLQNSDPLKRQVNAADLPELQLITLNATGNLFATSSTSEFIRRYQWVCATGDYRLRNLHAVEWAIACAMLNWKSVLGALCWPIGSNHSFVKRVMLSDFAHGYPGEGQRARGIAGWQSIMGIEVMMHIPHSLMLESSV